MTSFNIESQLNKSNLSLLKDLRKDFKISFVEKDIDHFQVYSQNLSSTIYYNPKIFCNASIAHELLHIKLKRYRYLNNHIYHSCLGHKKLNLIFKKVLCDHISNCFDHLKMYPEYLSMGYSPKDFLRDGLEEKCNVNTIKKIKIKFFFAYRANSINLYVGNLISIYADHIDNNYDEHLRILKSKEPELFNIVTKLWHSWEKFDITKIDPIYNSDLDLFESFISDLENWVRFKRII